MTKLKLIHRVKSLPLAIAIRRFFCTTVMLALTVVFSFSARAFQHPGIALTTADLDNVKTNLNKWPWSDGYSALTGDWLSNTNFGMHGPATYVNRNNGGNYDNESSWKVDMQAIYNQARMWYFTGAFNYGQKAHDMLLAWANTMTNFGGIEAGLDLGDYAYRYGAGADILRATWPGWTTADTLTVSNFFRNVYLPATGVNTSTGTVGPSNKGALQMSGALACAVFLDDTNLFNQILYLYRTSASCGLHNNCLTSGEMGETGRDQGHAYDDLLQMAFIAEVFYKQGIDVYSEDDNRLLACGEYWSRNNMSPAASYITFGTTDEIYWNNSTGTAGNSAGGYFAGEPMAGNILRSAYVVRKGLTAPWMEAKRYAAAGTTVVNSQGENEDSFCYLKTADTSAATPPAPIVYPSFTSVTSGLINADIGTVGVAGSGTYSGGNWTVTGGGAETWTHSADSLHFVYKALSGNCTIIAKVNAPPTRTATTAKAGVMIRDSLSSTAGERAWVAITADSSIEGYNHGWSQIYGGSNWETFPRNGAGTKWVPSMPYWVKLERLGNTITTYISLDGTSWEVITVGVYNNLPSTTYVGLFICALNTSTACTGVFSNVSITGGNGGNVTVPPAPYLTYASPDAARVPLRWLKSFGATNYNVLRSTTNGGPYISIASVTNASYVDTNVLPDTTYYYVIQASNSAGVSTNSPQDSATTLPLPPPPTGLNALPGNARATLLWVPSSSATSYNVKRSTTSGSGYVTVTNITGTSYLDTGLVNGTTYFYVLTSVDGAGEGAASSEASVTPSASAAALFWSGAVNGTWDTATANWLNNGASATFANGNSVIFDDSATANTTISLSATRTPGAMIFNNASKSYTFSGSAIAGTGPLIKLGGGSLTLSSANTWSGGTTNTSGTLTLGNSSALGSGRLTMNGGTLNNNANITVANAVALNGVISIYAKNGSGDWAISGALTGGGTLVNNLAGQNQSLNINGDLSGFAGTLQYADFDNTYNNVNVGGSTPGSMNMAQGSFSLSGGANLARALRIGGSGAPTFRLGDLSGAGGTLGINSGISLVVGSLGFNSVFAGTINGSGGLTKVGSGTLLLTGANTYTGTTTVSNGELIVSTASQAKGHYSVANGATFGVTNTAGSSALASNLTVAAGSALEFQNIASTTVPLMAASNVIVSGSCTVKITGTNGLVAGNSYPLVSYAGAFSGMFTNLQLQMPYGWRGVLTNGANQIWLANVATVSITPPQLSITPDNPQMQLVWPATHIGWRLQAQTNSLTAGLGTNWTDISGAVFTNQISIPIASTNDSVFFRLIYP